MTWVRTPFPDRFDVPAHGVAFVPLTPAALDDDYAAVMRDVPMLRTWSGQDWPTPAFTRLENLADLTRHDQEQRDAVALTYSVLLDDALVGCIYVHPFPEAVATRDAPAEAVPQRFRGDVVVRGWAHDLEPLTLVSTARLFLRQWPFGFRRVWWQANTACRGQLSACDELGLTEELVVAGATAVWVHRAPPHR